MNDPMRKNIDAQYFTTNVIEKRRLFSLDQNRSISVAIRNQARLQLIQIMGKLMRPNEQFKEHTRLVGPFEPQ